MNISDQLHELQTKLKACRESTSISNELKDEQIAKLEYEIDVLQKRIKNGIKDD